MNPPRQLSGEHPAETNYYPVAAQSEEWSVPLHHYLWVLRRHKWRIAGFIFAVVAAVLLYSLQMTPVYESVATLEIENQAQMFEVGDGGMRFDNRNFDTVMATQLEVMDTTAVARQVVRELHLERNPAFNPALKKGNSAALAGIQAQVPDQDMPASLPGLSVQRRPETYLLEVKYRSASPELASAIANTAAQAFVQQGFMTRYQDAAELSKWLNKQLEELKAKLERSQQALMNFEREHNVVNPEDRTNVLNLELQKLEEELSRTEAERLRKESSLREVRSGGVESLAISEQGEPILKLADRLESLETALTEAAAQYGPNHPNYKRVEAQVARTRVLMEATRQRALQRMEADYQQSKAREKALTDAVTEKKGEVDKLNAYAMQYGILKREVESQTKLHDELLKKINEASINASIRATNLRLAGLATTPTHPVSPNIRLNLLLALLLSTTVAIGAALAADYLDRTLRSSEQVEQWLSLPVLANLPRVQGRRIPSLLLGMPHETEEDEGEEDTKALAIAGRPLIEALSMLRTSVLLSAGASDLKVVLVASAAPAEGKSTVASGLAMTLAQQVHNGHRILLVDSDLRRPTVHNIFGLPNRVGLSTVLEGQSRLEESVLPSGVLDNLRVLPAGPTPRFASELLAMHLAKVLENIRAEYQYVVIDSAPLLVCADSSILSTMVDGVLLVARAGETPREAVSSALRQLRRVRANVLGLVLNQVRLPENPGYGTYYGSYYHRAPDEA